MNGAKTLRFSSRTPGWHSTFTWCPTRQEAIEAERQIKGWSREKKLALAEGDWELLQRLSLRRQPQKRSVPTPERPFMVREPHHEREGATR